MNKENLKEKEEKMLLAELNYLQSLLGYIVSSAIEITSVVDSVIDSRFLKRMEFYNFILSSVIAILNNVILDFQEVYKKITLYFDNNEDAFTSLGLDIYQCTFLEEIHENKMSDVQEFLMQNSSQVVIVVGTILLFLVLLAKGGL